MELVDEPLEVGPRQLEAEVLDAGAEEGLAHQAGVLRVVAHNPPPEQEAVPQRRAAEQPPRPPPGQPLARQAQRVLAAIEPDLVEVRAPALAA